MTKSSSWPLLAGGWLVQFGMLWPLRGPDPTNPKREAVVTFPNAPTAQSSSVLLDFYGIDC